jgi:hypothetical protein
MSTFIRHKPSEGRLSGLRRIGQALIVAWVGC